MTAVEPTRERVEAYEAALGCDAAPAAARLLVRAGVWWCERHDTTFVPATDLGCPVAVAAARVEAERVAEVVDWLMNSGSGAYRSAGAEVAQRFLREHP